MEDKMINFKVLEVGKRIEEGIEHYQEGCKFDFSDSGGLLLLFYNSPTEKEIIDITKSNAKIGICEKEGVLFLLWKFGSQPWLDTPYSIHLSQKFEFQPIEDSMGYSIHIILVDAQTGIVKGMRLIAMPNKLSKNFKRIIIEQDGLSFDKNDYDKRLNMVYGNYSTGDLIKFAELYSV
jgi:hypothetical protein